MPDWDLTASDQKVFDQMWEFQEHLEDPPPAASCRDRGAAMRLSKSSASIRQLPQQELKVDSMRPARRIGPDGQSIVELIIEITQRLPGYFQDASSGRPFEQTLRYKGVGSSS